MNLQKWIQQPSISNSGEGIPESAEMVKGFLSSSAARNRGSTTSARPSTARRAIRWSTRSATKAQPRTLLMYWMYDTMPVTQPDVWVAPPFEGRLVEQAPFKKVLIGRGATNSKGRRWRS